MNLFPRQAHFPGNDKGLTTLNFVPSIATMVFGLYAADLVRGDRTPTGKAGLLALAGSSLIFVGLALGASGLSPIVKTIWTPGWVLVSGGVCFLYLAVLYLVVDFAAFRRITIPLVVIGSNSLAAYVLSHVYPSIAFNAFRRVFGTEIFKAFGETYEPFVYGAVVLTMYWMVLFVLHRRRLYVRIKADVSRPSVVAERTSRRLTRKKMTGVMNTPRQGPLIGVFMSFWISLTDSIRL